MILYKGVAALSAFRLEKLRLAIQAMLPSLKQLQAQYMYFVDVGKEELHSKQQAILQALLGETAEFPPRVTTCLVVPRLGTLSPWSSKATDIAHTCGLRMVRRIERGISYHLETNANISEARSRSQIADLLQDRMTEQAFWNTQKIKGQFTQNPPAPLASVNILTGGQATLLAADAALGLALSDQEISYLLTSFQALKRNPTDVELMMFAQVNSEHCRHKVFNAQWHIEGQAKENSLFDMIKSTAKQSPKGLLSVYHDNAAVMEGPQVARFLVQPGVATYHYREEAAHILMKVETHNHPTAISPFPGAATGSGGEIRDEGATGRGGKPKAGVTGFSVSNLRIPAFLQPWEVDYGRPQRMASALDIMLQAPLGSAGFNNEFGRPNLGGYFRSFEAMVPGSKGEQLRGYHKPIMLAGGIGTVRPGQVDKAIIPVGTQVVVLGGPSLLIGLGGGAASSKNSGESSEDLDFASVQRGNPEIQRRCQEVIDRCIALGENNPIFSIHDVGAGGLSNAVPELVNGSDRGGRFELRQVPSGDAGLSPMQLWCNEAQERYVLAISAKRMADFKALCQRERCPMAVIGEATQAQTLLLEDSMYNNRPIELAMALLFGATPKMLRKTMQPDCALPELHPDELSSVQESVHRVLRLPAVADKRFLITIGDRSVTGLVARDQMVGPWQVPVADVAVTLAAYQGYAGEAMAMGERAPLALVHPAASARMAIAEAITNIAAAQIANLSEIKLSANWMAAVGLAGEDTALFQAVEAASQLCQSLTIAIPVGKDSLSMRTIWQEQGEPRDMAAPLSLIVTAFAPVTEVRATLTPQLVLDRGDTELILIDLGQGANRLAGSALTQVHQKLGRDTPDLDHPETLRALFNSIQQLNRRNLLLAYHDRSDGGLLATISEMCFAAHCGATVQLDNLGPDPMAALFCEELGVVIQVACANRDQVFSTLAEFNVADYTHRLGSPSAANNITFKYAGQVFFDQDRVTLQRIWSETSWHMQSLRDNPACANEEYQGLLDTQDPGLSVTLPFDPTIDPAAPMIALGHRPKIAILREQGVNGQTEMAAAFDRAGFCAVDLHMTDLLSGQTDLTSFQGLAACGGFSYGDVLGAGQGWAKSILFHSRTREAFASFFADPNRFSLGVCNGCQMMAQLQELIPGANAWPTFQGNHSEQFEARFSLVEILPSPSLFFQGMEGARLPIAVAHGEGRACFSTVLAKQQALTSLRYIDHYQQPTERYPANPNGSPNGITGLTTTDGRATILMPHPERVFRSVQMSWYPDHWGEDSPWLRMFRNARVWVG